MNELFAQINNDFVLFAVDDNIINKCNNLFNGLIQKQSVNNIGLWIIDDEMCEFQITHNLLGDGLGDGGLLDGGGSVSSVHFQKFQKNF